MAKLLQCLTHEPAAVPYHFKETGINVYSFEEVLYHCYYHWRQSIDECVSAELIEWTNTLLGLAHIAAKMQEIAIIENSTEQLFAFLTITPYFDEQQIIALKKEIDEANKPKLRLVEMLRNVLRKVFLK